METQAYARPPSPEVAKATTADKLASMAQDLENRAAKAADRLNSLLVRLRGAIPQEARKDRAEPAPAFLSRLGSCLAGLDEALTSIRNSLDEIDSHI